MDLQFCNAEDVRRQMEDVYSFPIFEQRLLQVKFSASTDRLITGCYRRTWDLVFHDVYFGYDQNNAYATY